MSRLLVAWALLLRFSVAGFWIFFASQRWFDRSWVRELFFTAAAGNYVPIYGEILRVLVPSWEAVTIAVTSAETAVGIMLLLGVYARAVTVAGALIALNLWLTFSFCDCWWNRADAPQVFWFYFSAMLLNMAAARERHASIIWRKGKTQR
ncbi:MAG: DoxX family membrane protein [Thaumarchaeota archaeon]|nr:DoxX family membrane protein [Candidatus Calditenuaceae archaeon]MDW8186991.1 DoxX family membrane protein [Nitrososphaerota archaeon]